MSENTGIWTPGNIYVDSIEKYQNLSTKKSSKKLGITAYVSPIIQEPYGTLLSKRGHILGENKTPSRDDCGQIFRKIQCSRNSEHHPSFRHVRCNDAACPICYVKYAGQLADRVTERVQGYKTVYKNEKVYHLIFWSGKYASALVTKERVDRPYSDLRAAFAEARRLLILMGATSAVVWYHPYRIRKELKPFLRRYRTVKGLDGRIGFWKMAHDDVLDIGGLENYIVYGPHWHAEATGFLMNVSDYVRIEGAGYKKKRYLDSERAVHETAHYISTHCCREAEKSSVRYFGNISYRMLAREMVEEKIKDVLCQDCGSNLEEYEVDDKGDYYRETNNGVSTRKLKDNVTEKLRYYMYWKRGQHKPEMQDKFQCLITRFSLRNNTVEISWKQECEQARIDRLVMGIT